MKIVITKTSEQACQEKEKYNQEYKIKATCPECGFSVNPPPIRFWGWKTYKRWTCQECGCEWEVKD